MFVNVNIVQGREISTTKWKQETLTYFLSFIGGLFTTYAGIAAFLVGGYQSYVHDVSMLKRLYGQEQDNEE